MSKEIQSLQEMLRLIAACVGGIPSVIPDGIFGSNTEASVRAFQKEAHLPVTGTVDLRTWQLISDAYTKCMVHVNAPEPLQIRFPEGQYLYSGTESLHVYLAQAMLKALAKIYNNLPDLPVSGKYDRQTEKAVRSLQKILHMEETSRIDSEVWKQLVGLYQAAAVKGRIPVI